MGVDVCSSNIVSTLAGEDRNHTSSIRRPPNVLVIPSPSPTLSSITRSLFGEVDHEATLAFLNAENAKIEEVQRRRWNFDFINCQPLEGKYKWEAVEASPLVPVSTATVVATTTTSTCHPAKVTKTTTKAKRSPLKKLVHRNKTTQASVTDYLKKTKRRSSSKDQ